jgi:hypothetical protein
MRKVAVWILMLMAISRASFAADESWIYADLSNPPSQLFLSLHGFGPEGRRVPVRICEPSSEYRCIVAEGFQFAVPEDLASRRQWTHDGVNYSVRRTEKFSLLGAPVHVYFIEQVGKDQTWTFLYDSSRGLIGMQLRAKTINRLYVLENKCGFAAAKSCS